MRKNYQWIFSPRSSCFLQYFHLEATHGMGNCFLQSQREEQKPAKMSRRKSCLLSLRKRTRFFWIFVAIKIFSNPHSPKGPHHWTVEPIDQMWLSILLLLSAIDSNYNIQQIWDEHKKDDLCKCLEFFFRNRLFSHTCHHLWMVSIWGLRIKLLILISFLAWRSSSMLSLPSSSLTKANIVGKDLHVYCLLIW